MALSDLRFAHRTPRNSCSDSFSPLGATRGYAPRLPSSPDALNFICCCLQPFPVGEWQSRHWRTSRIPALYESLHSRRRILGSFLQSLRQELGPCCEVPHRLHSVRV